MKQFVPDIQEKFYKSVGWTNFGKAKNDTATLKFADIPVGYFPTAIGSSLGKACASRLDLLWFGKAVGCYQKIFVRTEQCNLEKLS